MKAGLIHRNRAGHRAGDNLVILQFAKLTSEHFLRRIRDIAPQLTMPLGSTFQIVENQRLPFSAKNIGSGSDRTLGYLHLIIKDTKKCLLDRGPVVEDNRVVEAKKGTWQTAEAWLPLNAGSARRRSGKMQIGIIGAGNVGGALGKRWAEAGHSICFGVPDPASEKTQKTLKEIGNGARAGTVREAASFGEAIALAAPWGAVEEAIRNAGDLNGKLLLDCTNPLSADYMSLAVSGGTSGAEQVANWAKGAKVVKIFNTTGSNNMLDPRYGEHRTFMPYCSDHEDAKKTAHGLAAEIGFDPVDCGPLAEARLLEPMALVWIHLAIRNQNRNIAFHLLRRAG